MTERKFTDEEVVKGLECCVKSSHFGECFENKCPLVSKHGCKVGKETLYPYALDLINRQKAEIQRLKGLIISNDEKHLSYVATVIKEERELIQLERIRRLEAEIEEKSNKLREILPIVAELKAETIKEFAKRLKEIMFDYYECVSESAKGRPYKGDTLMDYEVVDMIEDSIDNLVKEMTEGL